MAGNGRAYACVAVDLNTQEDFCSCDGAYPVSNLESVRDSLNRLFAWAVQRHVPIISSVDTHRAHELCDNGYPVCCVEGSAGQRKMDFTLLENRTCVQFDNTLSVPLDLFSTWQQVVFRQRGDDLLSNPKADRFITQLPAQRFLVFGNGAEAAVKVFALGLIAREKHCVVIRDACGHWDCVAGDLAFRQMEAKGVELVTLDEILQWDPTLESPCNESASNSKSFNPQVKDTTNGTPLPRNGASRSGRNGHSQKLRRESAADTIPRTPKER